MKSHKPIATTIYEYLYDNKNSLLAPNGNKSNLSKENYVFVRTKEFKKWFGDWEFDAENASKVVDENGEPLIVYHGTPNNFNDFEITDRNISGYNIKEYGIYFTDSILTAKEYSSKPEADKDFLDWNDKLDKLKNNQDWSAWEKLYISGKDRFDTRNNISSKNGRILKCFLNIKNPFIKDANGKHWFTAFKDISFSGDGVICSNVIEVYNIVQNTYIVYNKNQIKFDKK